MYNIRTIDRLIHIQLVEHVYMCVCCRVCICIQDTPLHYLCRMSHNILEEVNFFVENGANIDAKNDLGVSSFLSFRLHIIYFHLSGNSSSQILENQG